MTTKRSAIAAIAICPAAAVAVGYEVLGSANVKGPVFVSAFSPAPGSLRECQQALDISELEIADLAKEIDQANAELAGMKDRCLEACLPTSTLGGGDR